jgi:hypothetical protein
VVSLAQPYFCLIRPQVPITRDRPVQPVLRGLRATSGCVSLTLAECFALILSTLPTAALSIWPDVEIVAGVRMSLRALCDKRFSTPHFLSFSHCLQMVWVDAHCVTAEVIYHQPFWNRADQLLVGPAMSEY